MLGKMKIKNQALETKVLQTKELKAENEENIRKQLIQETSLKATR